ncbi:hypothetical protein VTO73DRAFT_10472 [Trametes versicolor]
MPARDGRLSSVGPCEVVPLQGELPCPEPGGYKERPRLCPTHHNEYVRLTAEYHATTDGAKSLYNHVRALKLNDPTSVRNLSAAEVEAAMVTTRDCTDIINKEIRERREHHTRFFVELDDGHEERIKKQRIKLAEVEDIASRLRRRKTALAKVLRRRAETARRRGDPLRRSRSIGTTKSPTVNAETSDYSCFPMFGTGHTPPEATPRPLCVAFLANDARYAPVRCARAGAYSSLRCQEHQDEYAQALSALCTMEKEYTDMGATVYYIRYPDPSSVSAQTLSEDIPRLTRYLSLADSITALSGKLSRLDGYSKAASLYRDVDMAIYGLSRGVVENLRTQLVNTRSKLLRSKPVQATNKPVAATSTQYRRETQDPYRTNPQATNPKGHSEDEDFGWGAVIAAAIVYVGVATFKLFRFLL